MSIFEAIKKLREKLTGQPGKGASITEAINDLTEGLTGEPGVGASIADAIDNLAEHADDISIGGGGETPTVLYEGDVTLTLQYGAYSSDDISVQSMQSLPDTIDVIWNGVEYLNIAHDNDYYYFGASYDGEAFDFSEYPFAVAIFEVDHPYDTMVIYGEEEGTFGTTISALLDSGGSITTTSLYVTANGDYFADEGTAYDVVNVAVPAQEIVSIVITNHIGTNALFYGYLDIDGRIAQTSGAVSRNETRDFAYLKGDPCVPLYIKGINDATLPAGITVSATNSVTGQTVYSDDGKMVFIILSKLNGDTELDITV